MILRRLPTDFRVDERLTPAFLGSLAPSGQGHAVYSLTKTSLTTPDATLFLARALSVKPGLVQHAGLKDKHAVTTQHVSVTWPSNNPPPRTLSSERGTTSWSATFQGFSTRPIEAADIDRNHFTIIVRDLTLADLTEMDHRIALLSAPASPNAEPRMLNALPRILFINYFGDQRFGSARHHKGFAAQHLIRGDFETALKLLIATPARKDSGPRRTFTRVLANSWGQWSTALPLLPKLPERRAIELLATQGHEHDFKAAFAALPNFLQQMAVDAYQSWLWNAIAARLASTLAPPESLIIADDDFGTMCFPPATSLIAAHMCDLPGPSPAATLSPQWTPMVTAIMDSHDAGPLTFANLTIPGLRRPRFGDFSRPLVSEAEFTQLGPANQDDPPPIGRHRRWKRTIGFLLPRGSYATVALRSIVR